MKAIRRTASFGVSAAHRFHGTPSLTPLLSDLCSTRNLSQTKWSFLKSMNSLTGHSSIGAEYKFPKFCTKATPNGNLDTTGVPTSVPVRVAHELLLAGHRYLDVRTTEEFNAGHAPGAINIPYWHNYGDDTTKNADFLAEISSQFSKDDKIIVGCKSGRRSKMAATDLLALILQSLNFIYDAIFKSFVGVEYKSILVWLNVTIMFVLSQ